jgi:hypothetical protein
MGIACMSTYMGNLIAVLGLLPPHTADDLNTHEPLHLNLHYVIIDRYQSCNNEKIGVVS